MWVTVAVLVAAALLAVAWTVGVVEGKRRETHAAGEAAGAERRRTRRLHRADVHGRARRAKIKASVTETERRSR